MSAAKHFAICIENGDYAGTLELRKLYEVLEDESAKKRDCVRVVDESGETICIRRPGSFPSRFRRASSSCFTTWP